jgi:hypothetical protein
MPADAAGSVATLITMGATTACIVAEISDGNTVTANTRMRPAATSFPRSNRRAHSVGTRRQLPQERAPWWTISILLD